MKKRIAIVCGGDSSEYEVSMRSAEGIYSFLDHERYDVHIVEMRYGEWNVHTKEGLSRVDLNDFSYTSGGTKCGFDYVYITIHGTPGEDGLLQGYLELLHLPYSTCSPLVEALTFDKYVLNNYLRGFGINVANSVLLRQDEARPSEKEIVEKVGLPCFVKPVADGSSFGVSKVKCIDELSPAIAFAFKDADAVMVEEFLDGMEIAQGVYAVKNDIVVLPATEVVTENEFFDYDAKYNGQVEEITPARISDDTAQRVGDLTREIYQLLHCKGIVRVDYILTQLTDGSTKINLLEVNTTPGMTATSFIPQQVKAAGLDIKEVLTSVIENSF